MPCNNVRGNLCTSSFNGSLRFTTPFFISPILSIVVAFDQCVRDEKMLKTLTTHDIHDVTELFSLADKCARVVEGCAWYTPSAQEARKGAKPDASTAAQGVSNKNNNKKNAGGNNQPMAEAPTAAVVAAATGGG
jgi:hypothetical protein